MNKRITAVLLVILILSMTSCSDKNDPLLFDRYSSYESYCGPGITDYEFGVGFRSIEKYYTEKTSNGVIIRVYVYDESAEHQTSSKIMEEKAHTLTRAKVREVYFAGEALVYELKPGDNIWLCQHFYVNEEENKVIIKDYWTALMVPGCEYLIYTSFKPYCCDNGIYNGLGIFDTSSPGVVPLNISLEDYEGVLTRNGFPLIKNDNICKQAIEKYINGSE